MAALSSRDREGPKETRRPLLAVGRWRRETSMYVGGRGLQPLRIWGSGVRISSGAPKTPLKSRYYERHSAAHLLVPAQTPREYRCG